ncbi:MAG: hypothetical protein Q8876_08705 [Bacillota bacterium]|nr:hypothetical protein [Bacillota bacterium]
MLIPDIVILVSIVLPICVAISLFRNYFLKHYPGSPKKYKGCALIFSYIGSLLCSLFSGYMGFYIYDVQKQMLERKDLQLDELNAMKSFIYSESKTAFIFVATGLILYFITFFLKKNIQKDINQNSKGNVSWDLSKLGKTKA